MILMGQKHFSRPSPKLPDIIRLLPLPDTYPAKDTRFSARERLLKIASVVPALLRHVCASILYV